VRDGAGDRQQRILCPGITQRPIDRIGLTPVVGQIDGMGQGR
jgi:hypothetical protein